MTADDAARLAEQFALVGLGASIKVTHFEGAFYGDVTVTAWPTVDQLRSLLAILDALDKNVQVQVVSGGDFSVQLS